VRPDAILTHTTHYFEILEEKFTIIKSGVKDHTAAASVVVVV
jgi:hypothetical protein